MPDNLERIRLEIAEPIAVAIMRQLAPFCERIEIAGSIRRRVDYVHDVELVVIPRYRQQVVPLFEDLPVDSPEPPIDDLHDELERLRLGGAVRKRPDSHGRTFWGSSDKRLLWRYGSASADWIPVDVFGATGPTWGAKLVLRTGPWRLSKRLVTRADKGGALPRDLEFRAGGLYRYIGVDRRFVPTPDEETVFAEMGLPYVAPAERSSTTFERLGSGVAR